MIEVLATNGVSYSAREATIHDNYIYLERGVQVRWNATGSWFPFPYKWVALPLHAVEHVYGEKNED